MSQVSNKVDWCLKKADREMEEGIRHRGLAKTKPDRYKALQHTHKAEHYLKATLNLHETGFSDISASTAFYAIYHALLAILSENGVESRNQECTFAYILSLVEEEKLSFSTDVVEELRLIQKTQKDTIIDLREDYQYGTALNMDSPQYTRIVNLAKNIIDEVKEELQK